MKIKILMVGKNKDRAIDQAITEFGKKLNPFCRIELRYLKDERITDNPEKALGKEALTIQNHLNADDFVIALDERGKMLSTLEFAKSFTKFQQASTKTITFIIGSAYGLAPMIKQNADLVLSLSPLTMSHQIARLVLLEQLYRIFTLMRGMPYHK
jgi:23S rRNA (pseudouridine1915-N3)-methyltransferase